MGNGLSARLALLVLASLCGVPGAAAQDGPPLPDDTLITLERTQCFGECPVYSVSIDARGNVVYQGKEFVRVAGRRTAQIAPARVAAILQAAERLRFFTLDDQYRFTRNPDGSTGIASDLPTTLVTIRSGGRSKRVEDYDGAPPGLKELEQLIDVEAGSRRWVSLDAATLDELVKEGWRPSQAELVELLWTALREDDAAVVKGLLERGADPNGALKGRWMVPLLAVKSAATARLLLDAGANPAAKNAVGFRPLFRAIYLPEDVAGLLIKAGLRPDDAVDEAGRTGLWLAACAGNAGVVSVLLAAGADPAASSAGKSAVDCAREPREFERTRRPPPALEGKEPYVRDFDRVIAVLEQALAKRSPRPL